LRQAAKHGPELGKTSIPGWDGVLKSVFQERWREFWVRIETIFVPIKPMAASDEKDWGQDLKMAA